MIEPTCELLQKWKDMNIPVKVVRSDNLDENKKLEQRCSSADWKFGINFKCTAMDTPKQNNEAEVGILTITNQGRSMMISANVSYPLQ